MSSWLTSGEQIQVLVEATAKTLYVEALTASDEAQTPEFLADWLGRLRLLYGVPFVYLVPNAKLLPLESIRFFYVDRNWTDRLVDGALSVGKTTTREYAHHHAVQDTLTKELDDKERMIRRILRNSKAERVTGEGGDLTGLLLRSAAVSGWPGIEVKAYKNIANTTPTKLALLRMERLSDDVLFCLFDDIPERVDIEEPREGIQFGVDVLDTNGDGVVEPTPWVPSGFRVTLRYLRDQGTHHAGDPVLGGANTAINVAVPVRKKNRRVVHVSALQQRLNQALLDNGVDLGDGRFLAGELAIEMLQLPYRQRFEGTREINGDEAPFVLGTIYETATFAVKMVTATLSQDEVHTLFPILR